MTSELQLVRTGDFEGVKFNCYQDGGHEFWGTREQIGEMLGYSEPRKAIGKIHERNKERLDRFSSVVNLGTEAGMRETTIYNFKGLLEICRYSNQPKADAVMDFLWDIADKIRRTGRYAPALQEGVSPQIDLLARLSSEVPKRRVPLGVWHPFYWLISGCMKQIIQARDRGFTWAQVEDAIYAEAVEKGLWQDDFKKKKVREVYKDILATDKSFAEWKIM